jgi:flagellar biosynthesis protein FliR
MTSIHLDKIFSGNVFGFLFIFSRIGSIIMLFPGLSEAYVSVRIRLMLALAVSFLLMGPLLPRLPPAPQAIPDFFTLLGYEVIIGILFGTLLRIILSTLESAGSVIALQTGLSNATILNPALATQSPLSSAFLSIAGVTLIFVTGLDHLLFHSFVSIYNIFPPGGELMTGDMAETIINITNRSFVMGIELAMPFFVMGLLMYMALGMMQKLLPNIQLFLVILPVQIWGGLFLLTATVAGIMTYWLHYFDVTVGSFLSR